MYIKLEKSWHWVTSNISYVEKIPKKLNFQVFSYIGFANLPPKTLHAVLVFSPSEVPFLALPSSDSPWTRIEEEKREGPLPLVPMEGRVPNGGRRREAEKQEHNSVQRTGALWLPKLMAQNGVQSIAFTKTDTSAIMTATNNFRTSGTKGCEA